MNPFPLTGIPEFYALMSEMDICVPAFSTQSADHGYYEAQASSTFAMAVECNVRCLILPAG